MKNEIIVFEKKETCVDVHYNDSVSLNGVSKISYTEHPYPSCIGGGLFYSYCVFDRNEFLMAQISVDKALIFEKDSNYNFYVLR